MGSQMFETGIVLLVLLLRSAYLGLFTLLPGDSL